jgi:hypothetical protein
VRFKNIAPPGPLSLQEDLGLGDVHNPLLCERRGAINNNCKCASSPSDYDPRQRDPRAHLVHREQ